MDIITVAAVGIIGAVLCVIVRQYKPEMAISVSAACGVVILVAVITMLAPSIAAISELSAAAGVGDEYSAILLKALAVCYITRLAADSCRDAGESAVAAKIELAGRAAIMAVSLPVFAKLAELVTKFITF